MGIILMPKPFGEFCVASRDALGLMVWLRTPHLRYLRRVAEHQDIPISHVFGAILDEYASISESAQTPRKELVHLRLNVERIAVWNRLSVTMGVSKAEVARRIIDEARQRLLKPAA